MTKKSEPVTAKVLAAMSPKMRSAGVLSASYEDVLRVSVQCDGAAHSNAFIDCCPVCLGFVWGRRLKS